MELWFVVSVVGAVSAGISNFFFKVAAIKEYSAELFIFYSSLTSITITTTILLFWPQPVLGFGWVAGILLASGLISALAGSLKVYALRYIDSTIYFPLFKLFAPLLAIIAGVFWFQESFIWYEWLGMAVGLLVPLILITKAEDNRQNNLFLGLLLVVVTGALSAFAAIIYKYSIDSGMPTTVTLWYTVMGIFIGSLLSIAYKTGFSKVIHSISIDSSWGLFGTAILRSSFIATSVWLMLFAFSVGGTLAVVQTIHSMYILIPIVLAIIFYNEHWNLQKAAAIVLSVVSLAFLG